MTAKSVLVPLAPGFEETEAVAIIDVLRRAELAVVVAGLQAGPITGAHGITIVPDATLDAVHEDAFDAIALPGGLPGAQHLHDSEAVQKVLRRIAGEGGLTTAICAAPMALAPAGVTEGRTATCYPGFEDRIGTTKVSQSRVVVDGRVITSRGPGTALEFTLTLVAALVSDDKAAELKEAMLIARDQAAEHVAS